MARKPLYTSVVVALVLSAVSAPAQTGSIAGAVRDGTGAPIDGATVLYNNVRALTRDGAGHLIPAGPAINSGVTTSPDGSFTIVGLPPGSYYLCAFGTKPNDLASCEWGQGSYRVQLADGQGATGADMQISQGALLTLRVSDRSAAIQDIGGPVVNGRIPLSGGNFKIGVMAGGRYARANFVSVANGIRSYAVAVPKTINLRLFVATALPITLSNGEAVPTDEPAQVISLSGQSQLFVDLMVP